MQKKHNYYRIAADNTPANVSYVQLMDEENNIYDARAHVTSNWVEVPAPPNTISRLFRFLHEMGHMTLHTDIRFSNPPLLEAQAIDFVLDILEREGITTLPLQVARRELNYIELLAIDYGIFGGEQDETFHTVNRVIQRLYALRKEALTH